ncbi:CPBP family glutamic-type intramembrane protease [Taibaiella soli]|uniref:CAAX prenyl protease 2/Lysostaphin resistance protein A-like domain-containing protein n=1 Tax=Taibaiella soli TaxID=1649169 RepID=A0A2W2ABV1_9BACT|nr:CPBP family glutamic-type intramembrane protease [Taibaiella soli]PZF71102.1 hypothetical protein DN068_20610 [Taibaiella soli]
MFTNLPTKKIGFAVLLSLVLVMAGMLLASSYLHVGPAHDSLRANGIYAGIIGLSAFVSAFIYGKDFKSFAFKRAKNRYLSQALMVAVLICWVPYGLNLLAETTIISGNIAINPALVVIGLPLTLTFAALQEMMWRGFLLSNFLKLYGFRKTSLYIGLISAVCQYPLIIHTRFMYSDTPLWFSLPMFTILMVSLSFVITYFRILSKSITPGIVIQGLCMYVFHVVIAPTETARHDGSVFFLHDTGVFYILSAVVAAVVCNHLFYKSTVHQRIAHKRNKQALTKEEMPAAESFNLEILSYQTSALAPNIAASESGNAD